MTVVILRKVCSWCGLILQEGTPGALISHGICTACAAKAEASARA